MRRYPRNLVEKIKYLRSLGQTYSEINEAVRADIPKSTLSEWCRSVLLPDDYEMRIASLNQKSLNKARKVALIMNKIKREKLFKELRKVNVPIARKIVDRDMAKIALAMLCLGEASKYNPQKTTGFYLGNSDPRIVTLFLQLLKQCFNFDMEKVRCTVQCRADQDTRELELFWQRVTGIPARLFYKSLVDPRTKGKPTRKVGYKGVLKVDYFDRRVQHELESLADLVYNQVKSGPEV